MKTLTEGLLIFGCGGHARSIADVALSLGVTSLVFIDENGKENEMLYGFPVLREYTKKIPQGWLCMPAAGDNKQREQQVEAILSAGYPLATLISPCATIGLHAVISPGCFVGHHAHVGPGVTIGEGCIINTGAIVEHESAVGNYAHVSINAAVAGRCTLGDRVFLGAGATVLDQVKIGKDITIGAGSVVIDSISTPGIYIGVPARQMSK